MAIWGHISLNVCMLSLAKQNKSDPSPRRKRLSLVCEAVLFHIAHLSSLFVPFLTTVSLSDFFRKTPSQLDRTFIF